MSGTRRWRIDEPGAGERIDRWLAARTGEPRNQIQRWITGGRVTVNGRPARASTRLAVDDELAWTPPDEEVDPRLVAEPGPLAVLYQDADLVVLAKPAGVAVHPGAGRPGGTLANFLLHRYPEIAAVGGPGRPGIVHRLDLDTTGVLVVARTALAYRRLSEAFAERRVEKTYLAVVYGEVAAAGGDIDLPIDRHARDRKRMAVRPHGRRALTRYRGLARAPGVSLVEIDLETGRTHQIRVHMKAIRRPLVGDPVYGEARWRGVPRAQQKVLRQFPRPALHAWRLCFAHPADGRAMELEAPVPADMRELWERVSGAAWPLT